MSKLNTNTLRGFSFIIEVSGYFCIVHFNFGIEILCHFFTVYHIVYAYAVLKNSIGIDFRTLKVSYFFFTITCQLTITISRSSLKQVKKQSIA